MVIEQPPSPEEMGVDPELLKTPDQRTRERELQQAMTELRSRTHSEMEGELEERIRENPSPTETELRMAAFREDIEPQARDAIAVMFKKGYATKSSGFYGENNDLQAVDGYFFVDSETEQRLEAIGAEVLDGEALGVPKNRYIRQIRFRPESADPVAMRQKWDEVAAMLPEQGGPTPVCDRVEEFRNEHMPEHPSMQEAADTYRSFVEHTIDAQEAVSA